MNSSLNKVGRELVLGLINRTNQLQRPLTLADVQLSAPGEIAAEPGHRNTQVTVYPAPGSNYIRSKTVTYRRLDFDVLLTGDNAIIGINEETVVNNTNDLIALMNARFGLMLTDEDVVYADYSLVSFPAQVTIAAAEGSYGYIGQVTLTLAYDLNYAIEVDILAGLDYPEDVVIENASPSITTPEGYLLYGESILGTYMTTGDNLEVEGFLGVHRSGFLDPYVTPTAGRYNLPLADTRDWSLSFGVGLLDTGRVSEILEGYDVTLEIRDDRDYSMVLQLTNPLASLVWTIEGTETGIVDSAPEGSLSIAHNSQRLSSFASYFPGATTNSAGALLGLYTCTLTLTPKRAVYVKPIVVTVVANITAA